MTRGRTLDKTARFNRRYTDTPDRDEATETSRWFPELPGHRVRGVGSYFLLLTRLFLFFCAAGPGRAAPRIEPRQPRNTGERGGLRFSSLPGGRREGNGATPRTHRRPRAAACCPPPRPESAAASRSSGSVHFSYLLRWIGISRVLLCSSLPPPSSKMAPICGAPEPMGASDQRGHSATYRATVCRAV